MRSKMTEKEFRNAVDASVSRQQGSGNGWSYGQAAVEAAREAGLEFAPEPKAVAAQLEDVGGFASAASFHAWQRSPQGDAPFDVAATYTLGIARFNAYPGLRLAVEREIEQIHHTLQRPYRTDALLLIADRLRAELEKGPKP